MSVVEVREVNSVAIHCDTLAELFKELYQWAKTNEADAKGLVWDVVIAQTEFQWWAMVYYAKEG